MKASILTSLAAFSMTTPALAQTYNTLCGVALEAEQLVGAYTLTVGNALVFGNSQVVPIDDIQTISATIALVGEELVLESGGYSVTLEIVGEDYETEWDWDRMDGILEVSSEDFLMVFNCSANDFPRVTGQASSVSDGVTFVSNYYLVVHTVGEAGAKPSGLSASTLAGPSIRFRPIASLTDRGSSSPPTKWLCCCKRG